jgi:regulation of enolase protein 1 (concanavalin A-like superfamily)
VTGGFQSELRLDAGARTDLFVPPDGSAPVLNAPRQLVGVQGDFMLSARVGVTFASTFDAGVLLVWLDEHNWAKLCLELSPDDVATVVSVVTRDVSDDCSSFALDAEAWLRVSRLGDTYAFHASDDGETWSLIRYFALAAAGDPQVGFLAQSPTGEGCTATFDRVAFRPERLADLRSGD